MQNILALDLSSKATGYCYGSDTDLIDYGCITASSTDPVKRIIKMRDAVAELIKKYKVKVLVLEEVRTDYKNAHTYKILTWLQAAIVIAAAEIDSSIEVVYIQPSSWRCAIGIHTGRGVKREELKKEDILYVNKKYNIDISSDDIADAIGIHDAYYVKNQLDEKYSWG